MHFKKMKHAAVKVQSVSSLVEDLCWGWRGMCKGVGSFKKGQAMRRGPKPGSLCSDEAQSYSFVLSVREKGLSKPSLQMRAPVKNATLIKTLGSR